MNKVYGMVNNYYEKILLTGSNLPNHPATLSDEEILEYLPSYYNKLFYFFEYERDGKPFLGLRNVDTSFLKRDNGGFKNFFICLRMLIKREEWRNVLRFLSRTVGYNEDEGDFRICNNTHCEETSELEDDYVNFYNYPLINTIKRTSSVTSPTGNVAIPIFSGDKNFIKFHIPTSSGDSEERKELVYEVLDEFLEHLLEVFEINTKLNKILLVDINTLRRVNFLKKGYKEFLELFFKYRVTRLDSSLTLTVRTDYSIARVNNKLGYMPTRAFFVLYGFLTSFNSSSNRCFCVHSDSLSLGASLEDFVLIGGGIEDRIMFYDFDLRPLGEFKEPYKKLMRKVPIAENFSYLMSGKFVEDITEEERELVFGKDRTFCRI